MVLADTAVTLLMGMPRFRLDWENMWMLKQEGL